MEQCIRQNNAVDIYEDYFETVDDSTQCEKPEAKTVHVFRDPTQTQYKRPVSAISWCPDGGSKIAIAYCNLEFQATHPDTTKESYTFKVGKVFFFVQIPLKKDSLQSSILQMILLSQIWF